MSNQYDSFSDEDDDSGILKQALHVEFPDDFNPNKIPQTGEEYLQHVVYERRKCKTWLTADVDRSKFQHQQTFTVALDNFIKKAPSPLLPSKEWQDSRIEDFINFRDYINFKITQESTINSFDEKTFLENAKSTHPSFSVITLYTQAVKMRMLQILSKYLDCIAPGTSIDETIGSWIYAILALLEKPLSPDSCYSLRELAKRCLTVRSNLDEEASEELYSPLNLFICIIAKFYDQLDLGDC